VPLANYTQEAGVKIHFQWLNCLYDMMHGMDGDGDAGIDDREWKNLVKGLWGDVMFPVLDQSGDKKITKDELASNWDSAITKAFMAMGNDNGTTTSSGKGRTIRAEDMHASTANDTKAFAKNAFLIMDRTDFEIFIYTVMVFRAMDKDGSGTVSWAEAERSAKAMEKLGLEEAGFGIFTSAHRAWREQLGIDGSREKLGDGGMQLGELLKFLRDDKKVFNVWDHIAAYRHEAAKDCTVGVWSSWSDCHDAVPNDGMKAWIRTRTRQVVTPYKHGGQPCPPLKMRSYCNFEFRPFFDLSIFDTIR